jgi:GxxExxY protein
MEKRMLLYQELSQQVIGAAIEVHKELGAGLLESAYKLCFARELTLRGIRFRMEVDLPIRYKGIC